MLSGRAFWATVSMTCLLGAGVPGLAGAQQPSPTAAEVLDAEDLDGFRIDATFVDAPIRDVLRFFSETVGLGIVIDPDVEGVVNVSVADAPWDVALVAILESHGLGFSARRGVVRVTTVTKLIAEAAARARLGEESERATVLRTVTLKLSYARAAQLAPVVERQLSARGSVVVDERTNSLVVTDTDAVIEAIRRLIEREGERTDLAHGLAARPGARASGSTWRAGAVP